MKPEHYNPKAREAFGKSLIDIGVGIYKGIMLLVTLVPMTFVLNCGLQGIDALESFRKLFLFMGTPAYFIFLGLLPIAFYFGEKFRREGLRHIHEIESRPPE